MTPSHSTNIAKQRNARMSKRTIPGCAMNPYVAAAPMNTDLEAQARDAFGDQVLPFPCHRTQSGWINARTGTPLAPRVVGWRVRGW
jgi:hypothetical protein